MIGHSIQVVARLTGISVHTLRAWERRYSAVVPKRLPNGRRVFSEDEIERLKLLSKLTSVGYPISEIANQSMESLEELILKVGEDISETQVEVGNELNQAEFDKTIQHLVMALENYKLDIISYELHKLRETIDTRDLVFKIFLPLIQKIGIKVSMGELTIAQEHALTSILRFHLASYVYRKKAGPKRKKKKILFATPEGDLHEFGILLSSVLASYYGFEFFMLGANLPIESLVESMNALGVNIIVIGTTDSPKGPKFEEFNTYFSILVEHLNPGQEVWAGGSGKYAIKDFKLSDSFRHIENLEKLDMYLRDV